ncbi:hypothetical protein QYF61_012133 [Mycteria americana]|uniref:Uncharacterized protein n=1 Tax=Mycteria americana TaxID=33587 RepID=A0AAN7NCE3_MYCAM|nr:hypothetical protein QYF61_012133 [Mycteria americana]
MPTGLRTIEWALAVVESDEVSPQPPFLQAQQPQVPQPLPISLVLQTLPQLRCPSLDTLQPLHVSLGVRGPTLNTAFEVRIHAPLGSSSAAGSPGWRWVEQSRARRLRVCWQPSPGSRIWGRGNCPHVSGLLKAAGKWRGEAHWSMDLAARCLLASPTANIQFSMSQHSLLAAAKANYVLDCISKSMDSRPREGIISLCLALRGLHPESCVQFLAPQYKKDIKALIKSPSSPGGFGFEAILIYTLQEAIHDAAFSGTIWEMREERPETWLVPDPALQLGKEDVGRAPSPAEAREASWPTSSRHIMRQREADGRAFRGGKMSPKEQDDSHCNIQRFLWKR